MSTRLRLPVLAAALLPFAAATALTSAEPVLIWSDEFNQPEASAPDPAKWVHELGAGGWGNNELQIYTDDRANSAIVAAPAATDGRALAIVARKEANGAYTSARLKTQGKFSVGYGRLEARLQVTNGQGLWPAFWMLGDNLTTVNWPACGEIDIMEVVGKNQVTTYGTVHGPGYSGANGLGGNTRLPGGDTLDQAFHTYAVDWSPGRIEWSFDGRPFYAVTRASLPAGATWVFADAKFFFLLNLAVGGNWPGAPDATTAFPHSYLIDYVRVYSLVTAAPASFGATASTPTSATLSWLPPAKTNGQTIVGYRIERATDAAFTSGHTTTTVGLVTSYVDPTVVAGQTYYYRVAVLSTGGVSDPTGAVQVGTAASAGSGSSHFVNIATRAYCTTGLGVTIGGCVIEGTAPRTVLVRALGPALQTVGLTAADLLPDPTLKLYRGADVIASNDDWFTNGNAADFAAAQSATGASPPLTTGGKDAALLVTLPPGVYTFVIEGKAGASGVVIAEVYALP